MATSTASLSCLWCCCVLQAFVYLAGLQLLLTSGRKSVLVMVASTVAGVLYRLNVLGVRRLQVGKGEATTSRANGMSSCCRGMGCSCSCT